MRDALRKTRRGAGSRDPREKERETRNGCSVSWNRLYSPLRGPIFSIPKLQTHHFLCTAMREYHREYHCSIDRCLSPNKIVAFAIIEDHGAPRCICLKGRRQENHALCVFCNFELHRNDSSRLNRHCSEFLRGDDETENRLASPTFPPWKGKAGHR